MHSVLSWLEAADKPSDSAKLCNTVVAPVGDGLVLSAKYRMHRGDAVLLSWSQLLSGTNAFFWNSGNTFKAADISDPRVGTLYHSMIHCDSPALISVLMLFTNLVDTSALSIVFTALNTIAFGVTLGLLVFVVTAVLFPDSVRAKATSTGIGCN
jgi:hypothetical protein